MLEEYVEKSINTTMIGALFSIETHFGDLLESPEYREKYAKIRKEILDRGNNQKKLVKAEMLNYNIQSKRFHYNIPVRRIK